MTSTRSPRNFRAIAIGALMLAIGSGINVAGSCSGSKQADIVATAIEAGSFETLVAAVQAAGLEEALRAEGPLTVFAPNDEAFAKLPDGTLEMLLKPENKDMLTEILTYHVAPGLLTADKVVELDRVDTLNGRRPAVAVANGKVMVGQATVTATDIMTSNGVIHVIDTVLLPEADRVFSVRAGRDLIRMAIERGVPLYNHGQAAACTAIYEVAARGLLLSDAIGLSDQDRLTLENAMVRLHSTDDARRQAWIMRHALDDVMHSLREAEHSGAMAMNLR